MPEDGTISPYCRMISVLIPERGRPQSLERLLCSLLDTAGEDENIEIIVQIDNDDPEWTDRHPFAHFRTRYLRRPRAPTLGEKLNQLALEARGGVLWFVANDMTVVTRGWPERFRETAAALPNGIGVMYPRDPTHPDHTSYFALTRRMYETVGLFAPPWFPYWFCDTWWDEIGILTGLRREIDVDLAAPDGRGRTHGLHELGFWVDCFIRTRPLRLRDAMQLLANAYGQDSPEGEFRRLREREAVCVKRTEHLRSPVFLLRWGGTAESEPSPQYPEVKAIAEQLLADLAAQTPRRVRVGICVPSGRAWEAGTATSVAAMAAFSAMAGIEVGVFNVQTSMISHGRNTTVQSVLEQNYDYLMWVDSDMEFPPDALVRLLKHEKDIVGATYNRRTPPYQTLGLFEGKHPGVMGTGLYEARLLPSGMLLVRAAVYRAMTYPHYAEGYEWEGENGLARFKAMMREYFAAVPPDEALDALDDTLFGVWMRDNFVLGENGEKCSIFSEDLYFCRKARRHGYQMWCDLALTHEMVHLGVLKVTTLPPATAAVAAE